MLDHRQLVMTILILTFGGFQIISIIILLLTCRKAPKGHEDDEGFHLDA